MFKKVGIIAKTKVKNMDKILEGLTTYFQERGIELYFGQEAAEALNLSGVNRESLARYVDLIIVLGGDGTFISAARSINECKKNVPILGINLGKMGFLTEIPLKDMSLALDKIFLDKEYVLEERMMIDVLIEKDKKEVCKKTVFNDVVVNKGALARIIPIKTFAKIGSKKHLVAVYEADGLIVSTPSGSTAYNLAAGGPIIYPTMDAFIITPICPHTLSNRPLVVPNSIELLIQIKEDIEDVMVTLDGQIGYKLSKNNIIKIEKSKEKIKLLTFKNKNYFDILREKLGWEERKIVSIKC